MLTNRSQGAPRGLQTLFHTGSLIGVTDGQLLERFSRCDGQASETAFAALVERHATLVWRTCRAVLRDEHDAADAFQATFLVLVRKAGSLRVRDSIAPWLYRVALRAANQAQREAKRRRQIERRAGELRAEWTKGAMTDDTIEVLHREIDRLPERHRIVIVLCDLEGRSYEEAARHLRCPVGTVRSRLSRARERLRGMLSRRGLAPAAMSSALPVMPEAPPEALTASTIRGLLRFASEPIEAVGSVSKAAVIVAKGVLGAMVRTKLHVAVLVASVAFGLLVPAWLSHARQAVAERPGAKAPAGERGDERVVNLAGNWILRGYPSGQALGLIRFDGPPRQPRATLLSITMPDVNRLAESRVDRVRIDEKAIRFRLHLQADRPTNNRTMEVSAYLPDDQPDTKAIWGSMEYAGQAQYPVKLERTDRTELDRKEGQAPAPWMEDLRRLNQTQGAAGSREMLEAMLVKYADTPMASFAAASLAMIRAHAGASEQEVRGLIDRAVRVASRYGHEMEIGQINRIIGAIVGREELEDVVLDSARRAVAMLRTSDPIKLQTAALKNLASALRRARKIDDAKALADARALDDRIAALARLDGDEPAGVDRVKPGIGGDDIPWARSYAAARQRAKAESKLLMVDFSTQNCGWCKRLDAEVFPKPVVAEAMRAFVPVKVDAQDGEGGPLVGRYQAHIQGYPAILFLDPTIDDPNDSRIAGKIFGFMPAASFAEQLKTIARLPKDVDKLVAKVQPGDGDAMRLLATALAMQGRVQEAVVLIDRAWGPGSDPNFERWAAVYNTLGDEAMLRLKLAEAADWFNKAARVAKRPMDVYNAHLGAAIVASFQGKGDLAARELEAAARVNEVSSNERAFARELLGNLASPLDGSAGVPEAVAAMKRLEADRSSKPGRN